MALKDPRPGARALLNPADLVGVDSASPGETAPSAETQDAPVPFANPERTRELHSGRQLLDSQDSDPWVGTTIEGHRVESLLGAGTHARVYAATELRTGARRAIKILKARFSDSDAARARSEREAQVLARVSAPNVVRLFSAGLTHTGMPYHIMELIEGRTLSAALAESGPMPPDRARAIARDLAAGLAAAHALGVVHRDLKPANVMLTLEGGREVAKILDFGAARWAESPALTRSGVFVGTPLYMAPEQIRSSKSVGPSADVYALGAIVYELLTGRPPFEGQLGDVIGGHLRDLPAPLSDPMLAGLVGRALQKDPRARPADGGAFLAELQALGSWNETTVGAPEEGALADEVTARERTAAFGGEPTAPAERARRPVAPTKRPNLSWVAAIALALVAGLAFRFASKAPVPEPPLALVLALNGLALEDLDEDDIRELVNQSGRAERAEQLAGDSAIAARKLARLSQGGGQEIEGLRGELAKASSPAQVRLVALRLHALEGRRGEATPPERSESARSDTTVRENGSDGVGRESPSATTRPHAAVVGGENRGRPNAPQDQTRTPARGNATPEAPENPTLPSRLPESTPGAAEVALILSDFGVDPSEVDALGLRAAVDELTSAVAGPALEAARSKLRARVDPATLTDEALKSRFARVRAVMLSSPKASAVQTEFLELRTRLTPNLEPDGRRAMRRKLGELENMLR